MKPSPKRFVKKLLPAAIYAVSISAVAADITVDTALSEGVDSAYDSITITQTGSIAATADHGAAISVKSPMSGGISNSGDILISDTEDAAWTDAILVYGARGEDNGGDGSVGGSIVNDVTGTITRDASGCTEDAYCIGGGISLYGNASVAGNIQNRGDITTSDRGTEDAIDAGILVAGLDYTDGQSLQASVGGDIVNSGAITSDFAAIYVGGARIAGDIINETGGELDAQQGILISNSVPLVPWPDDGDQHGMTESGSGTIVEGSIINRGAIRGREDGGIVVEEDVAILGDIVNSGAIDSRNGADGVGDGIGMYGAVRSIANSGSIVSDDSGIQSHGAVAGSISNTGTISILGGEAWGDAIAVGGTVANGIVNSGTITRNAATCNDDPYCLGGGIAIYETGVVAGGITNSGDISTSIGGLAHARDAGILLMAVQDTGGDSHGAPHLTGDITNSGTIASDFAAIYVGGATIEGSIVNEASGVLTGGHGILLTNHAAELGAAGDESEDVIESAQLGMVESGISAAVINGDIVNRGEIVGQVADGITVDGDVTIHGSIINTGTIATLGSDGYGAIWFGDEGSDGTGARVDGAIINSGILRAPTVTEGTITVNGAHQVDGVINLAGGLIENTAAGNDRYAIWVDDVGSIGFVTNAGTIRGDVDFGASGGVFDAVGGTNDAIYNASRINIRSNGSAGATVSTFADPDGFVYDGVIGVDAIGTAGGLAYGQVQVEGPADVRGATVEVMVSGERFIENGSSFTFLKAGGALQSDTTSATDNSVILSFDIAQTGNALTATVRRAAFGEITSASDSVRGTAGANTLQVAQTLDRIVAAISSDEVSQDSELGDVVNQLSALGTIDEVAAAVKTLQPEVVGSTVAGASAAGNAAAGTIGNRQASLRGYGQTGMVAGDEVALNGFWMQVYDSSADQDMRDGIDGYNVDTTGLALGADAPITEHVDAGFALTYGKTDVETDRDNAIDIDSYQLSVYGSYNPGRWFADGIVSYARNQYDTSRTLFTGAVAKGDYDGDQYDARVRAGYPFAINERLQVTPFISAQYTYLDEDKYRERGVGNAGLEIDAETNEALVVGASVEAAYTFTTAAQASWVPSISLGVYEDVIGDEVEQNSSFIGLPSASFATRGADVASTSYVAGLGLQVFGQSNFSFTLSYDFVSKEDYKGQSASAAVRYAF